MATDQARKPESTNACCAELTKKLLRIQESRNALRQAVKLLEQKINELEAQNVNLKKGYEEEQVRAKILEEKLKESNAKMCLENEECSLKPEITLLQQNCGRGALDEHEDVKVFQACISDKEKEINHLKELLEREKIKADSEKKNAEKEKKKSSEAWKLLEAEKNKADEKGLQIAKVEARAEEYQLRLGRLEKEANEGKSKLASEMSKFNEANQRFQAEKKKLLAEKKNAESELEKARKRLEVEKQSATKEKRRADAEMVKVEEQKKLAEDNWKKALEEKNSADKLSQQLEEYKRTIENLKQKIHELSSLRKPIEIPGFSADIMFDAESTKLKLLENRLKLEKLKAKHALKKCKLEASRRSILQHQLGCLKLDFIKLFHRLDLLDASCSPLAGSMDDVMKSGNILNMQKSNVMRNLCGLGLSQMHSQHENELKSCRTTMDAYEHLRKTTQHAPVLALSGGNCAESITGIDFKLELPVGGSNQTKLQSSAVNSSTASFSDAQLMGSQERSTFPVTTSTKLAQETFSARPSISNPCHRSLLDIDDDRTIDEHCRKRKKILDTVEYIENLSSEGKKLYLQLEKKLTDVHGLYGKVDESFEGGRRRISKFEDNLLEKNVKTRKKRKRSHREKVDKVFQSSKDEKKSKEKNKVEICEDKNAQRHACYPAFHTVGTTQACRETLCDAADNFDSMIIDKITNGNYMKLLDLDNAAAEDHYRRAINVPLSPSLPEIEFCEVETDNLDSKLFLEKELHEDLFSPRGRLLLSPSFDVIDVEIKSNEQKGTVSGASCNSQDKSTEARNIEVLRMPQRHTSQNVRGMFPLDGEIGSIHNCCIVLLNIEDSSSKSRIFCAAKNCIARCSLVNQTGWVINSIMAALKMEENLSPKEKVSVLLTLLLFNFTMTASMKFGKLFGGNLIPCLNSYAEHTCSVMSDAETRVLFSENYLPELLCLLENFVIEGRAIIYKLVTTETISECKLKNDDLLDVVDITMSSEVASSEQLVAASIILASVCAATDNAGFIWEASYNIIRLCKWDCLMVLTILHIFSYLGDEEFFNLGNFGLTMTVLKSIVMFLEGGSQLVDIASCLPSIDQLHIELCKSVKCPFSEGAVSVDIVASLLLEKIKNCLLQRVEPVNLSNSRFLSDNHQDGQWSNLELVQCADNMNSGVLCCLKKYMISATQTDTLNNITMCHLSDVLSLVELVAYKMGWHWTNIKFVHMLLNMLDSCAVENFAIAIIVLLGQLGRLGVDAFGYEDRGVENLRSNLLAYLCCESSMKAGPSVQIAAATALLGLLPLDLKTLLQANLTLPAGTCESVYGCTAKLRKWLLGLEKDRQELLYSIVRGVNVYKRELL